MMASFIPYHGKKRDRLQRLVVDLRRMLARGTCNDRLLAVAAKIRDCRIAVLRARQNQNPESNAQWRAVFLKLQDEIEEVKTMTVEAVLAEYLPQEG